MSSAVAPPVEPVRTGILAERELVEIRFGGTGGQGVILMGVVLAMAATRDHRQVVQTQSYGPEARGGYSRSDVIISDNTIDYPQVAGLDLLVAMSQQSATGYSKLLRPNGVFIYDCDKVLDLPHVSGLSYGIPFAHMAKQQIGKVQTMNILTLGAVVGITGVASKEALEKAMKEMVPKGTEELNGKALSLGLSLDPAEWQVIPAC
jgi:2-oxoglutarate ferredoxin oxidoreductase subunit gamma